MKINKYQLTIVVVLLLGGVFLHQLISSHQLLEQKKTENKLKKAHSDAIQKAVSAIDVYATLVSSLKSYIKNTQTFPTEKELQNYLNDLLDQINFNDSIVINYLDKDHVFKYVISPNKIDAAGLKGVSLKDLKGEEDINELDELMKHNKISLFAPINLREGWVGFPFNFSVRDKKNKVMGYVAPIINVKYLLDYFYDGNNNEYVHKFIVEDSIDLTREIFYDNSKVYNKKVDAEYYKNYNIDTDAYLYSNINVFDLNLKIGSAFKSKPKVSNVIAYAGYLWYLIILLLVFVIYNQFSKNKKLNSNLVTANNQVKAKNSELEKNLFKIETLIKEIHHRVKNNMHMISGILTFQQEESSDINVKSALEQSKNRIHSMALVHEKLYGSLSLKDIKAKEYIEQLLGFVMETIANKNLVLEKTINVDQDLIFDGDTTSNIGLIINELVTNSFKYAFKNNKNNTLEISILKENKQYVLIYTDSGSGLPENYNFETTSSLGMQLILILADQLKGEVKYSNNDSSIFKIYFSPIESSFSV